LTFGRDVASTWTQGRWNEYLPSQKAIGINFERDGIDLSDLFLKVRVARRDDTDLW
jgi:hypothetical protein